MGPENVRYLVTVTLGSPDLPRVQVATIAGVFDRERSAYMLAGYLIAELEPRTLNVVAVNSDGSHFNELFSSNPGIEHRYWDSNDGAWESWGCHDVAVVQWFRYGRPMHESGVDWQALNFDGLQRCAVRAAGIPEKTSDSSAPCVANGRSFGQQDQPGE